MEHATDIYLAADVKSSVTSAPSPNCGTAEALSRRRRRRRTRWRRACAALPRRTRIAVRTHDQPEAVRLPNGPWTRMDLLSACGMSGARRTRAQLRTRSGAGRPAATFARAPVFVRCHLLEWRKPVVATVALSVCLLTSQRRDASALRPRPRPLRRGSPSCARAW